LRARGGTPVSLRDLLERPVLQRLVGHDGLQARVLALQLPQTLGVLGLHPAELALPA